MTDPVYVTTGAWGSGTGTPLSPATIDTNFYVVVQRLETLEDDPPTGPYPTSISLAGTSFTMGLSDGSTLGPITFTIPMPSWRGDWVPSTSYQALNFFRAPAGELGAVMIAHTSAGSFDWAADDGSGNLLYTNISGSATGTLDGLSGVVITAPVVGDGLVYDGANFVNQPVSAVAELDDLDDVTIIAGLDYGQTLVYSPGAVFKNGFAEEIFTVAVGDESTTITTGTAKYTFRVPYLRELRAVRASLSTASGSGAVQFDINQNGTTIFSTPLTIDATEKTSVTAATPAVINLNTFADDDEITIDFDSVGSGAKGAKFQFFWTRLIP